MNVLITAPSLNIDNNVSGISSIVGTIIDNNRETQYLHFIAGRQDGKTTFLYRMTDLFKSYCKLFLIFIYKDIALVHQNLPLNTKAIYREYIFFMIAKLFGKKIMVHVHGGKYLMEKKPAGLIKYMITALFKGSDSVVCLSGIEKSQLEKTYGLKDVHVIENTVDASYLQLTKTENPQTDLTVLFLGRLHSSKGIGVLCAAIEELMRRGHKRIQFIFCGAGPLLQDIIDLTIKYPVNVKYLGVVGGESKKKLLSEANVFVLPSLYGEGLPMSLLEAMAAGLVPIVTNDGSMTTVINHQQTGFIIDKNDPYGLTRYIEMMTNDKVQLSNMSFKAKNFAINNFSIQQYIINLNKVYRLSVA